MEENINQPQRDEKGKWLPGTSGNPSGRPAKPSFGSYFTDEEREALINTVKQELKTNPNILKMVVEQLYGKPKQPLTGGDEEDKPVQISYQWKESSPSTTPQESGQENSTTQPTDGTSSLPTEEAEKQLPV